MKSARSNPRQEKREAAFDLILSSAVDLVLQGGAEALTMSAIAKKAGMSRPGLYQYFSSKEDVVADLLLDELKLWGKFLERAIESDSSPQCRIEGWLEGTIEYMQSGHHQLVRQLSAVASPDFRISEIRNAHTQLMNPLLQSLNELGIADSERVATHIQGVLDTTVKRIDAGNDSINESEYALSLVRAILTL